MKSAKEIIEEFESQHGTVSLVECDGGADGGTITLSPGSEIDWVIPTPPPFNPIENARKTMYNALMKDNDLGLGYIANIAMLLHDRYDGADFTDRDTREQAAIDIITLIFG